MATPEASIASAFHATRQQDDGRAGHMDLPRFA
jgi:hypothetical protein